MRIILNSCDDSVRLDKGNSNRLLFNPSIELEVDKINVTSVQIPNSFYNINKHNNKLFLQCTAVGFNDYITITEGSYNVFTIADELQTMIRSILSDTDIEITYNLKTMKFEFYSLLKEFYLTFNFLSYKVFGFNKNELFHVSSTRRSGRYVASMNYTNQLFIRSNITYNNIIYQSSNSNLLCSIPVNVQPGEMIHYSNHSTDLEQSIHRNVSYIEFEILDQYLKEIDLNGVDWCIEINFK